MLVTVVVAFDVLDELVSVFAFLVHLLFFEFEVFLKIAVGEEFEQEGDEARDVLLSFGCGAVVEVEYDL